MNTTDPKEVEASTSLSQSRLWAIQQNYFRHKGIAAWDKDVPSYISTNAFTATRYAAQCVAFMQDWCDANPDTKADFVIFEIAAGTGRFAFYCIKAILDLLKSKKLEHIKIHYVISDLSSENVRFYQDNPVFKPYIEADQVDFGIFDIEKDTDVTLIQQKKPLSQRLGETPLIVIANYAFDFLQQELIEFLPESVESLDLSIQSRFPDYDTEKVDYINELTLEFKPKPIKLENYYDNAALNQLLAFYREKFKEKPAAVSIPLGASRFYDRLEQLSNGHYFSVIGDKGQNTLAEMERLYTNHKYCSYDGIYTFRVNFHALGWILKQQGGQAILSPRAGLFKTNVFYKGLKDMPLTHTESVFDAQLVHFSPDDFCDTYDDYFANAYRFTFGTLQAFLRTSEWDPIAYDAIHTSLMLHYPELTERYRIEMIDSLKQVRGNLYAITSHENAYLSLGVAFQTLGETKLAIEVTETATQVFPKNLDFNQNLGLLYEKDKNPSKAIEQYQKVVEGPKQNVFIQRRLTSLTGEPGRFNYVPFLRGLFVFVCLGASFYILTR